MSVPAALRWGQGRKEKGREEGKKNIREGGRREENLKEKGRKEERKGKI